MSGRSMLSQRQKHRNLHQTRASPQPPHPQPAQTAVRPLGASSQLKPSSGKMGMHRAAGSAGTGSGSGGGQSKAPSGGRTLAAMGTAVAGAGVAVPAAAKLGMPDREAGLGAPPPQRPHQRFASGLPLAKSATAMAMAPTTTRSAPGSAGLTATGRGAPRTTASARSDGSGTVRLPSISCRGRQPARP